MRSLTRRLILVVMLVSAAAFILTIALTLRIVSGAVTRDFDARLSTALNELSSAADIGSDGILSLSRDPGDPAFNRPNSGWYWSIAQGPSVLARSRSLRSGQLDFLTTGADSEAVSRAGPAGEELRIRNRTVRLRERGDLLITVAGPARTIRDEVWSSTRTLIGTLGAVAIVLLIGLAIVIRRGLRPLRQLANDIGDASRGNAVNLKPPGYRELDPLAGSISDLMTQVQGTIERSRVQAGNLAHAIKTPLSLISARNQQRGGAKDRDIDLSVSLIERQIGHHLKRTRFAGKVRLASEFIPVASVVDDLVLVMTRSYPARALQIHADIADGAVFLGEREDLEEILGNILDNACKWAKTRVDLAVRQMPGAIEITVQDDGPGLAAADRERALERGCRLDETVSGTGIGLSIVADLVALYGGELDLQTAASGGLLLRMTLPSTAG